MQYKDSTLFFIDRANYSALQGKDFGLQQIVDLVKGRADVPAVSTLTQACIHQINARLSKVFFDCEFYSPRQWFFDNNLSKADQTYVSDYALTYLSPAPEPYGDTTRQDKKYYEIVPLADSSTSQLLLVVEEGFFDHVTENKDQATGFVLDCLSYQYRYASDTRALMKLYLSLRLNEGYLDLVKLRLA